MENSKNLSDNRALTTLGVLGSIALIIIALLYFDSILKPFVIALLIWFIINQLKLTIGKIKIKGKALPPTVCNVLSFIIIFSVILLVGELLINNLKGIAASMPEYMASLQAQYGDISSFVNNPEITEQIENGINKLDLAGFATSIVNSLSGVLGNAAVITVYVIFFVMEDATARVKFAKMFPEKGDKHQKIMSSLKQISESIRSFLWQKTLISLITGAVSYVILLIMGVEYAFLWSFLIFTFNFIPYIGPLISSIFPAIFAVVVTGDLMQFVYVFAAMEGVQIILGNFVEPMMMGKGTNLGPVTVIVALAFWGMIWGMVGMILAVPVTAVLVIALAKIPATKNIAIMLSEKGNIYTSE